MTRPPVEIHKQCDVVGCYRDSRSNSAAYCEMHYYRLRRGSKDALKPLPTQCAYCDSDLEPNQVKYCSSRCNWRGLRNSPKSRQCVVCGSPCDTTKSNTACSDKCVAIRRNKSALKSKRKARKTIEGRCRSNDHGYVTRAKKYGVDWELLSSYEVFVKADFICQICGEKTDKDAVWPEKSFPSLDHIIPMSGGGKHVLSNVQCAHLGCNLDKAHRYDKAFTAKAKRMAGETGQYARRARRGESSIKSRNEWPQGQKIASRGFSGGFKPNVRDINDG